MAFPSSIGTYQSAGHVTCIFYQVFFGVLWGPDSIEQLAPIQTILDHIYLLLRCLSCSAFGARMFNVQQKVRSTSSRSWMRAKWSLIGSIYFSYAKQSESKPLTQHHSTQCANLQFYSTSSCSRPEIGFVPYAETIPGIAAVDNMNGPNKSELSRC